MKNNRSVLLVATTAYMIRQFNMENIKLLQSLGYQVEVACNFIKGNPISDQLIKDLKAQLDQLKVIQHQIPIVKSPFNIRANLNAYIDLQKLMIERKYSMIHCQTPVGAVLARFASSKAHIPSIYMAHGFHFFQGASLLTWLLYYPVELYLSSKTEVLILLNSEDYQLAEKKMKAKRNILIPGVGIDVEGFLKYNSVRHLKRADFGIPENKMLLLSVGELNKNKNHELIIRACAKIPDLHYAIAGQGHLMQKLHKLSESLGIMDRIHFLGYRQDVIGLYQLADIYCHPSFREGLSVSMMEAMAAGLPIICSDIRGNRDLISDNIGGILLKPNSLDSFVAAIKNLMYDESKRQMMGNDNMQRVNSYDIKRINDMMFDVYNSI